MKKIGKKKEQEFVDHYENLSDALFRHCYFRVSDREIAMDLMQESFVKTWSYIRDGNEIENLKAFLYRVTNNLIIDYYRKKKSDSLDTLLDAGFDFQTNDHDKIFEDAEMSNIKEVLESFSEKDRSVIVMRYMDGLSVKEMSEILDEPENTLSVRLHRAISKVKTIITP